MRAYERFLQYVGVETTSDPKEEGQPTSPGQRKLAKQLAEEMRALGLYDVSVSEAGYVYGFIPAMAGYENAPPLGLVAHLDTSPDACGREVKPLLHKGYDGKSLQLPGGRVLDAGVFPGMARFAGETLITASGDTLLGADDKAGIAEILTVCERLLCGGLPHGRLCIAFTPDEEIGRGTDGFDLERFGARFAYTVDGAAENEVEYETFNAAAARVVFTGVEVHPGAAKGIMVNAASLAAEFDGLLPKDQRPENTEGREGFFHLTNISGTVGQAVCEYIIRDHSRPDFETRKGQMQAAVAELNRRHGEGCASLQMEDTYYNMGEVIEQHLHLVENAKAAVRAVGLAPVVRPVRGGTDGSRLSFMGLPCPNLGTGGTYFHGPNECISVEAMDRAVEIILKVVECYATWEGAKQAR